MIMKKLNMNYFNLSGSPGSKLRHDLNTLASERRNKIQYFLKIAIEKYIHQSQ